MLDSNGSNTTAVAAVVKIEQALGDLKGRKIVILAGTGPVGQRAAGLLAKGGAHVTITSRKPEQGDKARQFISARFEVHVDAVTMSDPAKVSAVLGGAEVLLNSGPAGVQMVPRGAWNAEKSLKVAVDLNAVPPLGIEGVDVNDSGVTRDGGGLLRCVRGGKFQDQAAQALHRTLVRAERPGARRRGDCRHRPGDAEVSAIHVPRRRH